MQKRKLIWILTALSAVCYSNSGPGAFNKHEIVLGAGAVSYKGEIGSKITTVLPSLDLGLKYFMSEYVAFQGKLTYAGLRGDDYIINKPRGYSFKTQLGEITGNFELYLFKENNKFDRFLSYKNHKKFNAYVFLGAGITYFSPRAYSNGELENLTGSRYDKISYLVPYGVGMKYKINKFWAVGMNMNRRITVTDYLDDYSMGGNQKDIYMSAMFNLVYTIKKSKY